MKLEIPAPYHNLKQPPANRGVFICIDTETAERHAGVITEIGIAVMRFHPAGLPDQPYSAPKISAQHFVVKERSSDRYRNGNYVPDHRDFFCYGTTQIAHLADIRNIWKELLISLTACFDSDPVYYVGHCISGDLNELKKMDFHIPDLPVIDTEKIWRNIKKNGKGNLCYLLEAFCIPHAFLHNAGNDAYLNLMVFQALCDPVVRKEHSVGANFNFDPQTPHTKRRRKKASDFPIAIANDLSTLEKNVNYLGKLDGYNRFITLGLEDEELVPRDLPKVVARADALACDCVHGQGSQRYERQQLSKDVHMATQTSGPISILGSSNQAQGNGLQNHRHLPQVTHPHDHSTFTHVGFGHSNSHEPSRQNHHRRGLYNSRGRHHKGKKRPSGSRDHESNRSRGSENTE